jgi:hypothetical protein
VFQFTYNWQGTDSYADATTQQTTSTGTQRLTMTPEADACVQIASYMQKYTQHGSSQLNSIFTNWVGFHNDRST